MKQLFPIFILAIMSLLIVEASSKNLSSLPMYDKGDSLFIIQLENNWTKALINKDGAIVRKYLSEDLIYTENDKLYNRDDVMSSVMSLLDTVENAYNENMNVHVFGNTAIVTGWLTVTGRGVDGRYNHKYRFTDIWMKANDDWQLIAAHDYIAP